MDSLTSLYGAGGRKLDAHADGHDHVHGDNESDANETESDVVEGATMAPTTVTPADENSCACPGPQSVTTFTVPLTVPVADLADMDFDSFAASLVDDEDAEVVVVPTIMIGIEYTLDVSITEAQCKAAVASAFSVLEADVECGDAASGNSTTTTPSTRRLTGEVQAVTISFSGAGAQTAAAAAATDSQDTAAFTTALAAGDDPVTATASVSEATVTVELAFTVTATDALDEPTTADVAAAATTAFPGVAVEAGEISGFSQSYTMAPCSADICSSSQTLVDDAEDRGCAAAVCTAEADRETCCVADDEQRATTGSAQGTCILGPLLLLLWNFFC